MVDSNIWNKLHASLLNLKACKQRCRFLILQSDNSCADRRWQLEGVVEEGWRFSFEHTPFDSGYTSHSITNTFLGNLRTVITDTHNSWRTLLAVIQILLIVTCSVVTSSCRKPRLCPNYKPVFRIAMRFESFVSQFEIVSVTFILEIIFADS